MKLLRVEAPHFVAGALWEKEGDRWICKEAAPILRWFIGKDGSWAYEYIKKKGWKYQWL